MKNNIYVVGCFLLLIVLLASACDVSADEYSTTTINGNDTDNKQTTPNTNPEKPVLQVATDASFAPFEYMKAGEIAGFDVEVLDAIMEEAGFDYQLNNLGWDPMLVSVRGGEMDLAIAGITINEDREQSYDFSDPYFESTHMIVFNQGTGITGAEDLHGLKVGVQTATTGAEATEKIVGRNNANISKYETTSLAFMELAQGNVDAVVTDNVVAAEYLKNNPNANVEVITDTENFESEYYGLMFPENSAYINEINTALATIIENGTYQEIYQEWFVDDVNTENLANDSNSNVIRFDIIKEYFPYFMQGMVKTILMSLAGVLLGSLLGLIVAIGKMSRLFIMRLPFIVYINVFRGTPMLVQLFLIHYAVMPLFMEQVNPIVSVIVTLSLNSAAYVGEIFRAGIQSIDKGQAEAAHSLGMNRLQVMRYIILPQAFKRMIPPLGNEFIVLLKDSSLGAMIAAPEILYWGRAAVGQYYRVWEPYLTAAIIYLILTLSLTYLLNYLERRFATE